MANKGKFIDRNPTLRTAGHVIEPNCDIGDSLKIYSNEEAAANVVLKKCREKLQTRKDKSYSPVTPFLPDENIKDLLSPELKKSRFIAFREKFAEDMFFKKPELGRVFPLDSKPAELTNESFTFGRPSWKSESLYHLVLPQRSAEEVNREYTKWHDKYIKSHGHYFPSERVNRSYDEHFEPHSSFGCRIMADPTGPGVRRCLQECQRLVVIPEAQRSFLERTTGLIGTNSQFPDSRDYGTRRRPDECDVRALLENITPCERHDDLVASVSQVNSLRRNLVNRPDFHMNDLKAALQQYDKKSTGYVTFDAILSVLGSLHIRANKHQLRMAVSHFKMIENEGEPNERVHMELFWRMLHAQHPLPCIGSLVKTPENFLNKDTTYRTLCQDHYKPLVPPKTFALKYKNRDNDRTRAGDLISPDIPMHYGLAPSDLELLRPKEDLRRLFKGVLGDNFDTIWELARKQLQGGEDCKMSVEYLRDVMSIK